MSAPLTYEDFPLKAIGALVYRRTFSSPLFTAPDDALAADLVARLNRDQRSSADPIPVYASRDATDDFLGKGGN